MSRNAVLRLAFGLLIAVQPATAFGQPAAVSGLVTDDTGAVLPGVSVSLRAGSRQLAETATNEAGQYRLVAPDAGQYDLRFSLINFGTVIKRVIVGAGQVVSIDAVLPLALTAEVTVTGRRTFRNLAEVENPTENLIGLADAASEGAVTARDVERRPLLRPGEVLETVPGLVISQHSGEGKANQYYLRGFNLDHGTDFAVTVAGVPVNMPTHGHGQGWSDVNFLIPELVSGVQFKKGPYYAEEGDFSTAGAANITYLNALDRPLVRVTGGGEGFGRVLAAASPRIRDGNLLVAIETGRNDGPWEVSENYRRLNGVARYSRGDAWQGLSVTAMAYDASWMATDQIPQRAVAQGLISRFGTLDPTDGGSTHRYTLVTEAQWSTRNTTTKFVAYGMDYGLDLFSNFTYLLTDPVNGDQFQQIDERRVFGGRVGHRRRSQVGRWIVEHSTGVQMRHDRIGPLGLWATRQRTRYL